MDHFTDSSSSRPDLSESKHIQSAKQKVRLPLNVAPQLYFKHSAAALILLFLSTNKQDSAFNPTLVCLPPHLIVAVPDKFSYDPCFGFSFGNRSSHPVLLALQAMGVRPSTKAGLVVDLCAVFQTPTPHTQTHRISFYISQCQTHSRALPTPHFCFYLLQI